MKSRSLLAGLLAALVMAGCSVAAPIADDLGLTTIPTERGLDDPSGAATGIRVGQCGSGFDVLIAVPDLGALDRLVDAAGGAGGMYDVDGTELFVGTLEAAAIGFNGSALFIGKRGDSWIRTGPGSARQLVSFETAKGRLAWLPTGGSSVIDCGGDVPR